MIRGVIGMVLLLSITTIASAQGQSELGASLASVNAGVGKHADGTENATSFGVPSATLGLGNPGVYWSVFVANTLAVEPQLGLVIVNSGGSSDHIVHAAGQVDYFVRRPYSAPYVFGSVGVLHQSDSGSAATSVSGGLGYRALLGSRLTMRFDGRVTHINQSLGNSVAFAIYIGGLFGRR